MLDAGRRLRDRVVERAPASVRDAIERYVPAAPPSAPSGGAPPEQEDPEDAAVIVYATLAEADSVRNIRAIFARHDIRVREVDLESIPKVARQIAQVTNVFVPPYVFIAGRFWGAEFDMLSLEAEGDLVKVVEGRLDQISEEARRIGRVRESFSDALSPENILDRLRRGHILCIDDLDCWYEQDKDGERFFYQGAPRPVADMAAVAHEIAQAAEADAEIDAQWRFEPEVRMN
jgi:glutaredoxin